MQLEHILQAHGLIGRRGGQATPLPIILNFTGQSNALGNSITINWENPDVLEFQKVQIFMSETDISNLSYDYLVANGNLIVNEKKETHVVTGLIHNDTRHFKAFGVFSILGEEEVSSGVNLVVTTKDIVPPATITNFNAKSDNATVELSWTNPADSDFSKVKIMYKQGDYPASHTDGTLAYEGSGITAIITGLTNDVEYYFRSFTYDTNGNINDNLDNQQITTTPSDSDDKTGSPGPKRLIAGTMQQGYFGIVPASELWTGTQLSSAVGISQGTIQFDDTPWLKFAHEGKILFRPMKAFRHSISWDSINAAGCVFGTKAVTKNGHTYKVRLMKGALTDPSKDSDSDRGAKGSEWNRLMLPIHIQAKDKSWSYPAYVEDDIPYWGIDFTDQDLHTHNTYGNGTYVWCQETPTSNPSNRVYRGNNGVSYSYWNTSSGTNTARGWAPVLEWVSSTLTP